jgi:hypothetical protein
MFYLSAQTKRPASGALFLVSNADCFRRAATLFYSPPVQPTFVY